MQIGVDEVRIAGKVLTFTAFKLYLLLAGNRDNYELEMNPALFEEITGGKKSSYYESINLLKEHKYLIENAKGELIFNTTPMILQNGKPSKGLVVYEDTGNMKQNDKTMVVDDYTKKIEKYISNLTKERQSNFIESAIQLYEKGKTNQWILAALTLKDYKDWNKWGFGLMFTESFEEDVDIKVNEENAIKESHRKYLEKGNTAQNSEQINKEYVKSILGF